uniref:Uncharacterized protein n=1 Tax=Sus scrofa TaxID=9823 RepID=A0A8D0XQR7_PIG
MSLKCVSPKPNVRPLPYTQQANHQAWLTPLLRVGYKRRLEEDDMYSVLPEDRSARLGEELQGYWDREVSRAEKDAREPSLMKAIIKCYWKSYSVLGVFTFLEVKSFTYGALLFSECGSVLRWTGQWGERPVVEGLR